MPNIPHRAFALRGVGHIEPKRTCGLLVVCHDIGHRGGIAHVRERTTCRDGERISEPPVPFHVTPRGWAGPSPIAMLLSEKFGGHQPLNHGCVARRAAAVELDRCKGRPLGRLIAGGILSADGG